MLHKEQKKVTQSLTVFSLFEPHLEATKLAGALRHRPPKATDFLAGEEALSAEGLAQGSLIW